MNYRARFTGHRPASFSIEGQSYVVESWRDILLKTCELVRTRKPSQFSRILELKGTKNLWFSREAKQLRDPVRIHGTSIFAETNVNANGLVLRSLHVLSLFGVKPEIDVTLRNESI
jgi:hypothetical protein